MAAPDWNFHTKNFHVQYIERGTIRLCSVYHRGGPFPLSSASTFTDGPNKSRKQIIQLALNRADAKLINLKLKALGVIP